MPWVDVIWTEYRIEHFAEHGVSVEDANLVLRDPTSIATSRSSGRPIAFGRGVDCRQIAVVYERVDDLTVHPITAYEL